MQVESQARQEWKSTKGAFKPGDTVIYYVGNHTTEGKILDVLDHPIQEGGKTHHATKEAPLVKLQNLHTGNITFHHWSEISGKSGGEGAGKFKFNIGDRVLVHTGMSTTPGIIEGIITHPETDTDGHTHHASESRPMAKIKNMHTGRIHYNHLEVLEHETQARK